MPGIEQSAGERFRTLPDLAWLADGSNLEEARCRELVAGGWCWVAEDDEGRPCAFLAAEAIGGELHICEIEVALDRQGRGIGRALVERVIAAATRCRMEAITLTTFIDLAWNAPLYERKGCQRLAASDLGTWLQALLRQDLVL